MAECMSFKDSVYTTSDDFQPFLVYMYVFAKECAIRIDKQQKERYNPTSAAKTQKNVATIYCADNYNESSIIFRCVMFRISLRFFLVR